MSFDDDGFSMAKPVPKPMWPPEDRINESLGVGVGLKGALRMRVARKSDVKKRGAKNHSEFYRRHGADAGKDPSVNVLRTDPNWRGDLEEEQRRLLDAELDEFLERDDDHEGEADLSKRISSSEPVDDYDVPVVSKMRADAVDADVKSGARKRSRYLTQSLGDRITTPTSKMRADYIDGSGLSLLERTSKVRASADDLAYEGRDWDRSREKPVEDDGRPRRRRDGRPRERRRRGGGGGGGGGGNGKTRPMKSAQELDDELDAFLHAKD